MMSSMMNQYTSKINLTFQLKVSTVHCAAALTVIPTTSSFPYPATPGVSKLGDIFFVEMHHTYIHIIYT